MKIFIVLLFATMYLFAHPHYFLDSSIEILDDKIKNTWKFDRLNSRLLMFEFDRDKDKKFDEKEKVDFFKKHFDKLKSNNYNIFLANENDEFKVDPKNKNVVFKDKKVQISFDINYKLESDTTICIMDEKIFIAYKLESLKTKFNNEVQKSEYDYCVGVKK